MPLPTVMVPEPPAAGPVCPPAVTVLPEDDVPPAATVPFPAAVLPADELPPAVTVWDVLFCASPAAAGAVSAAFSATVSFPAPTVSPGADVSPAGSVPLATGPSAYAIKALLATIKAARAPVKYLLQFIN